MKRKWIFFVAPPAIALFVFLFGEIVMHLWNWLLPMLFGFRQITFWQGLGLLALCRILFGGWGGGGSHRNKQKRHLSDRWEKMTPEEREQFRGSLRNRCGGVAGPAGQPGNPA
jgi:hypothetical protein